MHLHAAQPDVFQLTRPRINRLDVLELDTKLVLVSPGCNLRVRLGGDIRIDAHGDRCALFQTRGNFVDAQDFRFALAVEGINPFAQREFNFAFRFGDASENTFLRVAARRDDALQFARAHHVETAAAICQHAHHGEIGVRLHRKTDQVIERCQRGVELLKMILQRVLGIDVKRRAEFFGERVNAHTFTE